MHVVLKCESPEIEGVPVIKAPLFFLIHVWGETSEVHIGYKCSELLKVISTDHKLSLENCLNLISAIFSHVCS